MLASELITRALRLINVPGRGAVLAPEDQAEALEDLEDLLKSASVSKSIVPGIRKHFFALTAGQGVYSYGPAGELDTNPFEDPVPVRVEDAYLRYGGLITDNEQVTSYLLDASTGWTVGANWAIANGKATASGAGTLSQTLGLGNGTAYTVELEIVIRAGDVLVELDQDASPILSQLLTSSGRYRFEITFAGAASDLTFTTGAAGDDLDVLDVSILPVGANRLELAEQGTDCPIRILDQKSYNRLATKGAGGDPERLLYSRAYPLAELSLDSASDASQILVLDVLVDRISVGALTDTVPLHGDALEWVKYALAERAAPSYGKELTRSQAKIMDDAYGRMTAGTRRKNKLRTDAALSRRRGAFHIDRID